MVRGIYIVGVSAICQGSFHSGTQTELPIHPSSSNGERFAGPAESPDTSIGIPNNSVGCFLPGGTIAL